ncbi:MAG TPA: hypothetical protein VHM47_03690 [Actinomycetota bacterium]|nr:hypothetical protein [Actinomycetota bacterium]
MRSLVSNGLHPVTATGLDCADVRFTNFKVLPPDPQHFDGDHDGVGCEG